MPSRFGTDPCPACASTNIHAWMKVHGDYRRPGAPDANAAALLDWCDDCQCGFLTPRPTHEQTVACHDITGYYGDRASNPRRPKTTLDDIRVALAWRLDKGRDIYHDTRTIRSLLGVSSMKGLRVLDLGCGNGGLLAKLKADGAEVLGVEPSPGGRTEALAKGVIALPGTAEDLPSDVQRGSFDVVIMQHVLEHCKNLDATLDNVKSLLKPGGAYICDVPSNSAHSLELAGPTWYWLDAPRHINFFTKQSLTSLLQRKGLTPAIVQMYGYTRQIAPAWVWAEQQALAHQQRNAGVNPRPNQTVPSGWLAWKLFISTAFAPDERKYDSLRVLART